ncbi:cysteine hydrolase family protein [Paracoccus jeotgali]|uniref:cysteine hydrolase family protein n=1 Tax=Paracoccus jeotgali TaxID=2065379 RepID=UPI0028AB25D2|nr:isochorismatase family protein [Paracoccus jeotgali]
MTEGLRHGAMGEEAVHLCVDIQELFGPASPWAVPWMEETLPVAAELAAAHAERTIFTRFIPPRTLDETVGTWRRYYEHWPQMLRETLDPAMLELRAPLRALVPPARQFDRMIYSPWVDGRLHQMLQQGGISTLIVTGGETDVCVMSTVFGAVDRGYRVVVVSDGVSSSADSGHDAAMTLYRGRLSHQIEVASRAEIEEAWRV